MLTFSPLPDGPSPSPAPQQGPGSQETPNEELATSQVSSPKPTAAQSISAISNVSMSSSIQPTEDDDEEDGEDEDEENDDDVEDEDEDVDGEDAGPRKARKGSSGAVTGEGALDPPLQLVCLWRDCNTPFETMDLLNEHMTESHIGSGKACYSCDWQGCHRAQKPFTKRHKMYNHLRTHTGERPFKCLVLGNYPSPYFVCTLMPWLKVAKRKLSY